MLCVHLSFLIVLSSELMSAKYYESNINELWNKKIKKKKQSNILNKNNHITKINTHSILLKIRKKIIISIIKFR